MSTATASGGRIATLDIVRGVAVMGILTMNIVIFAMPEQAYVNPTAYGTAGAADLIAWYLNFIFFDGKMRGLFSFLFGASMLLVIERADAKGLSSSSIHFRRMAWLLLFGLFHFYVVWFGDILAHYALAGMIAWFFLTASKRALIRGGILLVLVQFIILAGLSAALAVASAAASAPGASEEFVQAWQAMSADFLLTPDALEADLALHRGGLGGIVAYQTSERLLDPLIFFGLFGWETVGYMMLGMAGLKTGFLTGQWPDSRYRKIAAITLPLGIAVYALLGWRIWAAGFEVPTLMALGMAAPVLIRPVMIVGTASLIILLTRAGGAFVRRIAAAGRMAFTNYLGTSIVMTLLFYGYGAGLYGTVGRAQLWLFVLAMWALMLIWSKPWLDRFRYGPFEWLWRSLARGSLQPMRKPLAAA